MAPLVSVKAGGSRTYRPGPESSLTGGPGRSPGSVCPGRSGSVGVRERPAGPGGARPGELTYVSFDGDLLLLPLTGKAAVQRRAAGRGARPLRGGRHVHGSIADYRLLLAAVLKPTDRRARCCSN